MTDVARRRIVVVGASLAGLRAAEALRTRGFNGELTIVGDETHPPYDRPPLSKQLLAGTIEPAACTLAQQPGLEATWLLGRRAVALDASRGRVELDDGARLAYDGLVIATGSAASRWPSARGAHVIRNLDDALALRAALRCAESAVIIGAGFVGCEVAATLRVAGKDVTLVDIAPHPMVPLGPLVGDICARLHADHGVRLRMDCGIADFDDDGRTVLLDDGQRIAADIIVVALGAVPNVDWLEGSLLELDGGVVTDAFCFADEERRIVAAGDVAVFPHPLASGERVAIRHWSNAVEQAPVAAANLLADRDDALRRYESVPSFWSDQYDVRLQSVGFPDRGDRVDRVEGSVEERRFVALSERDGHVVGAVAVNRAGRIAAYRRYLADELSTATSA